MEDLQEGEVSDSDYEIDGNIGVSEEKSWLKAASERGAEAGSFFRIDWEN